MMGSRGPSLAVDASATSSQSDLDSTMMPPPPSDDAKGAHRAPASDAHSPGHGGDPGMDLFDHPGQMSEPVAPEEERRLIRKIDLMILPYLSICYAFFYIDKTTLSYAAIFGIREDLWLSGADYSWLSSIFYFGFIAWAIPTNLLMQRYPVGKYLSINIFLWGFFLMLQATVQNFASLMVLRFLAGASEAAADPSFMLITSMWYTRKEQPVRFGIWYTAIGFGIALGGLFGYGIGSIRGRLASWRYEFIIIGALCSAWGVVMFVFLPDSPVTARRLSIAERRAAVRRLRDNQTGIESKTFKAYQVREALADVKLYLFFAFGVVANVPNGGISNFGTLLIRGFGYSPLVTTLMQIPYGLLIALFILLCVFLNDRFENRRCLFMILFILPNIAGAFGLRYVPDDRHVARLICYYVTAPTNAAFVMAMSLQTANTAGHTKKVVTNAVRAVPKFALSAVVCHSIANSASAYFRCSSWAIVPENIAGPFFYLSEQAPYYSLGIWSMIVSHALEIAVIGAFWAVLRRENKRRDAAQAAGGGGSGGGSTKGLSTGSCGDLNDTAFADLTDRENPNFRYIY